MGTRIPKVLYHYCSVPTFFSIVSNRSVWLSDVQKSNDSQELRWIKGQCRYYTLKAWVDFASAKKEIDQLSDVDFAAFDKAQSLLTDLIDLDISKCWVFCVSEKRDSLGQWRGYGDDGRGVSVGFKRELFQLAQALAHIANPEEDIYFCKVKYTEKDTERVFGEYAGFSDIKGTDSSEQVIAKIKDAIGIAMANLPFFKNEAFKEEKEWRLAYSMYRSRLLAGEEPNIVYKDDNLSKIITIGNYGFAHKNGKLVSHVELGIPQLEKFIDTIIIGPKSELTQEDILLFLINEGMLKNAEDKSIKIVKSSASYR